MGNLKERRIKITITTRVKGKGVKQKAKYCLYVCAVMAIKQQPTNLTTTRSRRGGEEVEEVKLT